ncbi:MAG: hypothetical protein RJQ07_01825 [Pseudomonadales bacterium]
MKRAMYNIPMKQLTTRLARSSMIFVMLLAVTAPAEAARFFRYIDDSGKLVLSHTIPNDRVKFGYEIVDENARVISRVAPQLSEKEYQRQLAEKAAIAECESAVARARSLYRSIDDIDYAETQALNSIETQINNLKVNLVNLKNQRQDLEEEAAQLDIAGNAIPNNLLDNIQSAKTQEQNLEEQIESRYAEKLEERLAYKFDRQVFVLKSCAKGLPKPKA